MIKTIVLNTVDLTSEKQNIVGSFLSEYLRVCNETLKSLPDAKSQNELHHLTYSDIRKTSPLPSDIVQEARKDMWARRKTVNGGFKRCSIRLNQRWFELVETDRGNLCFRITYAPYKRVVIPLKLDGGFDRFNDFLNDGWSVKIVSLLWDRRIATTIEKEFPEPEKDTRYAVGVDVGSDTLAAVTVYNSLAGKVERQLYFGRDVAVRQRRYLERRKRLQSHADKGSRKAKKYLKRMKRKQRNFVKTRSGQVAKEIVNLANGYNASIAIEDLEIRGRKHQFNKKSNRKINKIPYAQLREFLTSNCEETSTYFDKVGAYHTSK